MLNLGIKTLELFSYLTMRKRGQALQTTIETLYLQRPFSSRAKRILFIFEPNSISFSQIFPFFAYQHELKERWNIELRGVSSETFEIKPPRLLRNADVICLQTWFDLTAPAKQSLIQKIRNQHPQAHIVYFDWFAPLDLRLAELLNSDIYLYVKKQVFRDRTHYSQPTRGDTNLMDYYSKLYDIEYPEARFPIPAGFLDKLIIGPGFLTANYMLSRFREAGLPQTERPIDMHARLGSKGSEWYSKMRQHALAAATAIAGIQIVTKPGMTRPQYLKELAASKLCFSPFGYGEVCWRDYEAAMCGSLLIKPDMSHLQTDPDIFVANETYVPVQWDFSDLEEKVRYYLDHPHERRRITENAFQVLHDYVISGQFLEQMQPVLQA